jgi:Flp pilus assembly protein TadG
MSRVKSRKRTSGGQALVEFALIAPLLLFLAITVFNFGGLLNAWLAVAGAARSGAQYAILGGSYIHSPVTASKDSVVALARNDLSKLYNSSSAVVSVCTNNAGTISCNVTPSVTTPADPENASLTSVSSTGLYCSESVDVTYTYHPFFKVFTFSYLGLNMPGLFSSNVSVHRRVVMRPAGGCS